MKYSYTLSALAAIASTATAHSWLGCVDHDNSRILPWMKGNATLAPPVLIDPLMPWFANFCHGWPRAKKNPGDWIDESTNYVWNIAANTWNGEMNACHPSQRGPNYEGNAPMATAKPGSTLRLMFGGNGHSRGNNMPNNDPGVVSVYWKGEPEAEITNVNEFNDQNRLQKNGFSEESFSYPKGVKSPTEGLIDKGNWQSLKL
jgi:hypothetical protein